MNQYRFTITNFLSWRMISRCLEFASLICRIGKIMDLCLRMIIKIIWDNVCEMLSIMCGMWPHEQSALSKCHWAMITAAEAATSRCLQGKSMGKKRKSLNHYYIPKTLHYLLGQQGAGERRDLNYSYLLPWWQSDKWQVLDCRSFIQVVIL